MKKILLLFVFILAGFAAKAQDVTDKSKVDSSVNIEGTYQFEIINSRAQPNIPGNLNQILSEKRDANKIVYMQLGTAVRLKILPWSEIKKSDFKDQSVADGISIFTDDRILFFEYLTNDYPFIIEYESEIESRNTALLRSWSPYQNLYESYLHASLRFDLQPGQGCHSPASLASLAGPEGALNIAPSGLMLCLRVGISMAVQRNVAL